MAKLKEEVYKFLMNAVPKSKTSIADHSRQDRQQNFTDCEKWNYSGWYRLWMQWKLRIRNEFIAWIISIHRLPSAENLWDSKSSIIKGIEKTLTLWFSVRFSAEMNWSSAIKPVNSYMLLNIAPTLLASLE